MAGDVDYAVFGLTEDDFKQLLLKQDKNNDAMAHQRRASPKFPFRYWEADLLKEMFEVLKDNEDAQALLAALMQMCEYHVLEQRAKKAAPLAA